MFDYFQQYNKLVLQLDVLFVVVRTSRQKNVNVDISKWFNRFLFRGQCRIAAQFVVYQPTKPRVRNLSSHPGDVTDSCTPLCVFQRTCS